MAEDQEGEVLFRPTHKRRKVLRKRLNSDDEDTVPTPLSAHAIVETLETDSNEPAHRRATIVQARKKGAVGRGITFSAADAQRRAAQEPKEQALVLASEHQEADAPQIERFVKPTGKAEVKEDKHMMAYVDSKLADLRQPARTESPDGESRKETRAHGDAYDMSTESRNSDAQPLLNSAPHPPGNLPTFQPRQQRGTMASPKATKRRKYPSARTETDVARDSMIEQIMGPTHVPHYQAAAEQVRRTEEQEGVDRDAAAEDAFKAQLLADLDSHRRRPHAPKNPAAAASGPKLGGSRAQREKMRALEEAKAGTSKK